MSESIVLARITATPAAPSENALSPSSEWSTQ
jgi:hypothetical protein